jgi:GntR family transcriptional regulator, transcriptional repressor for pyruvate dehydrogenase complex
MMMMMMRRILWIARAAQFGVSRPTIREALRELSAMSLIGTTKGASGGSFVTVPTVDHISRSLSTNIHLLSRSEHVSLDESLEARDLLEVAAARLAASRRTEEDLEKPRAAISGPRAELPRDKQFSYNKLFTRRWCCTGSSGATRRPDRTRSHAAPEASGASD